MIQAMTKSIIIPIYISILTLPLLYLRYYPFLDRIRFKKRNFLTGIFVLLIFEWYCAISVIKTGHFFFVHYVDGIRLLSYYLYFAYSCIAIKEKVHIHAFSCILVLIFCGMLTLPCSIIEIYFEETYKVYLFRSIALVVEMIIFLWAGIRFNKRFIVPLLNEASSQSIKICTAVLFLILTNDYVPTWNITWLKITPITYVAIRLVSVFEAMVVLMVFRKAVTQHKNMSQLRKENESRDKIIAVSQEHFNSLESRIQETRRLKHDFKHKLIIIEDLARNDKKNDIIAMIHQENQYIDNCTIKTFSKNYQLNVLLSYYVQQAEEKGINCNILCHIPVDLNMKKDDLWNIVGNLLTNAIEANNRIYAGEKSIDLRIKSNGSLLAITEKNRYCEDYIVKEGDRYISSKKTDNSGNGLDSIRLTAKKYNGDAVFKTKDNWFVSTVYAYV